jgi:glutaredoxin
MAAREAFAARGYAVDYRNAKVSPADLAEMLKHSGGQRLVPVILEDGKVALGFEGGT